MIIIIADAHVNEALGNHNQFFDMLTAFESCDHDLVFLGDIFDLWIALPRYESRIHHRFLSWCKQQKQRRTIGFIEGNHEYFIADERKDFFSWCTAGAFWQDRRGTVFCHGDQVNRLDSNYLFFRKLSKNRISKQILRCFPLGPWFVEYLKARLKDTNLDFRKHLPSRELETFAEQRFREGGRTIFVGHFHRQHFHRSPAGGELHTVQGWLGSGSVTLFDVEQRSVSHRNWQELF
ncbi:MAG: metallophosphoesterase [Proteobacteria bacterium]|nr:metallophosphoesterase [Pseudomonadota bacterium]